MSKFFARLQVKPQTQRVISYVFYALFALLIIYNIMNTTNNVHKLMYGLLLVIPLGFALWSEHLKSLYQKAIHQLAFDLDPTLASQTYDELIKKDKANAYKNSRIIFDVLVNLDQLQLDKVKTLLSSNEKFFHSSLDQLLIYHYVTFMVAFLTNDVTTAKDEYKRMERMKDTKVKGMKVSPLFNWDFLLGMYQFMRKDVKQSINTLNSVNTTYMNPRECAQYYYVCAKIGKTNKDSAFYTTNIEKLTALNGKSALCRKGENI